MLKVNIKSLGTRIEPRRIITVGGTLFCAFGIGYLMQGAAPAATTKSQLAPAPTVDIEPLPNAHEAGIEISDITPTSGVRMPAAVMAQSETPSEEQIVLASLAMDTPVTDMPPEMSTPAFTCDYTLSAKAEAAAMVTLTLDAPCLPNERFTLHHNGMMFTDATDANGMRVMTVPALSEQAVFIASFAMAESVVASADVLSLRDYERVVVQWAGSNRLQIHALEFGADYGDTGHIWAENQENRTNDDPDTGGFLTRLGAFDHEDALLAEVYTFPSARAGTVELSVEAEVTPENCGQDVQAQSIQTNGDAALEVKDVVVAIPGCDAIGDFLVLKNLVNDLKVAGN